MPLALNTISDTLYEGAQRDGSIVINDSTKICFLIVL